MRNALKTMILVASVLLSASVAVAQEKSSSLQCVADQLSSCKIRNTSVNASALSQYSKAFNCMKYGSTSGTKFDLNIPIPEVGLVGFGFGDSSQHSTSTCREEIKKLESSSFVKTYSEVFSADCGKTLAGQYEQCLRAKVALETALPPPLQSLQCNAVQSSRNLVVNLRYTPAIQETATNYKVTSVVGVAGMTCEKDVVPGIYAPSSMHCEIPKTLTNEVVIVRLANTVSCQVPLQPERSIEIASAKKHSCASILGKADVLGELPSLVRFHAIGMCDSCLAANLATSDSDQRTLSSRLRGCLVWSAQSVIDLAYCKAAPMPELGAGGLANPFGGSPLGPSVPGGSIAGYGNPFLVGPGADPQNPNASWTYFPPATASAAEIELKSNVAKNLCITKGNVEVLQRPQSAPQIIPIDFLATSQGQNPVLSELIKAVDVELK